MVYTHPLTTFWYSGSRGSELTRTAPFAVSMDMGPSTACAEPVNTQQHNVTVKCIRLSRRAHRINCLGIGRPKQQPLRHGQLDAPSRSHGSQTLRIRCNSRFGIFTRWMFAVLPVKRNVGAFKVSDRRPRDFHSVNRPNPGGTRPHTVIKWLYRFACVYPRPTLCRCPVLGVRRAELLLEAYDM